MASTFRKQLAERQHGPPETKRRWVFVAYDQLSEKLGLLAELEPHALGIILVENPHKAARRPYHQQKLALVLSNLRHFALEQAERGVRVRHVVHTGDYAEALSPLCAELGPLSGVEPAERELRQDLAPLVARGQLRLAPHRGWLTTPKQFEAACPKPPYRMDSFYRTVRRESGLLMERGKPVGGRFSFDGENRKAWPHDPPAPEPPRFAVDAITEEVGQLIRKHYADHPGRVDLETLPASRADAAQLWAWAKRECLVNFGPFEDAMSSKSSGLFHTRISPLLNLYRLWPADLIAEILASDAPLSCREGLLRQILGWREFVRHVHRATDGFRTGGAPNFLAAESPLPPAYWGTKSGFFCLDHVVESVWREGYSHHITRLMILSNWAQLLDASPRELTDWFWVAYIDAYDWVVEPNMLAMGTFAAGELMTTKPYVAGAAYVHRMSDFCGSCAFDPKKNCPLTPMYWAFLNRHRTALAGVMRMKLPLASAAKRSDVQKEQDAAIFETVQARLNEGAALTPATLPQR